VHNGAAADRWVVTMGTECDPFSVGVPTGVAFQCICECPAPPNPSPSALRRLHPGDVFTFTWDARGLATCRIPHDCGTTPPHTSVELRGELQPVEPGAYHVDVAYAAQLPINCSATGDTANCYPRFGPPFGGGGGTLTLCPDTSTVRGDFTLAASGDVSLDLTITQ
jgi:hypothetical protein